MTDLFVHVRMKECCRKALTEIDGIKKGIRGTGAFKLSLAKALGDKTVPDARSALATTIGKSIPEGDKQFTSLKRKSCAKAAAAHAAVHKGRSETIEAALWEALAAVFEGKSAPQAAGAPGLVGGTAVGKLGAKLPGGVGDKIAQKAKEKVDEYQKAGITYAPTGAPGTADCSHFVHDVLRSSGLNIPYVTTNGIKTSKYFTKVTDPQPGDVIWQPGHMGIYMGKNEKGQPLGAQMGKHGAALGVWGEEGWFEYGDETKFFHPAS